MSCRAAAGQHSRASSRVRDHLMRHIREILGVVLGFLCRQERKKKITVSSYNTVVKLNKKYAGVIKLNLNETLQPALRSSKVLWKYLKCL